MKLLVFTYAPAGLGHLRVTDALVDNRPKGYRYIMLGSYDKFITKFHRFFSVNPIAKWIFTVSQYGLMEDLATAIYRGILTMTSGQIYKQLTNIVNENRDSEEIWVIATHFGMAHQIGAVKERVINETGKTIRLFVQVTDDTSQHIWCIRGTDLTFVPSLHTKKELEIYANRHNMNIHFEVAPYPISPILTNILQGSNTRNNVFDSNKKINVAVPISGASVGLSYISKLVSTVALKTDRYKFWILAKKSIYTDMFLINISKFSNVSLIVGRNDNEMISLYEKLYQNTLISIEITKPSEQAFKAILPPSLVGGSILLFTSPVGRQEYENIDFLVRQGLMPRSNYDGVIDKDTSMNNYPRAVRLSKNPEIAANFIIWALENGLYAKMSSDSFKFSEIAISSGEVGPDGAKKFWEIIRNKYD